MVMPSGKDLHFTRDEVVQRLRMVQLHELADTAAQELPETVDGDFMFAWLQQHGYTRDDMTSMMGGSP
jgi:hypothetical protein